MNNATIVQAANELAIAGRWNDIFNGTQFSIYSITWVGTTPDYANSRWVYSTLNSSNYPNGFTWSVVNKFLTQFEGVDSTEEGVVCFKPAYDNDPNYLTSQTVAVGSDTADNRLSDYDPSISNPASRWTITRDTSRTTDLYFLVDMPIFDHTQPLVEGTIGTGVVNHFGIDILKPGTALSTYICTVQTPTNILTNFCTTFCSGNPSVCQSAYEAVCYTQTDIDNTACINWCSTATASDCDSTLLTFCDDKLVNDFGNDVQALLNSQFGNMCACFLPDATMSGYASTLNSQFKVIINEGNIQCYYPPCLQNGSSVKPFKYKDNCNNCPNDAGCIETAIIDVNGDFIVAPVVNQSVECKQYNGGGDPNVLPPSVLNLCTATPIKANVHKTNSSVTVNLLPIILGGIVGVTALGLIARQLYKHKKKF